MSKSSRKEKKRKGVEIAQLVRDNGRRPGGGERATFWSGWSASLLSWRKTGGAMAGVRIEVGIWNCVFLVRCVRPLGPYITYC